MIENIINMLRLEDYYGESELIDIAKGKYKYPETLADHKERQKRIKAWRLKRQ